MRNPDNKINTMDELRSNLYNALQTGNEKEQKEAFTEFATGLEKNMMTEAKKMMDTMGENYTDEQILVNRGIRRQLTSKEKKFFNQAVEHQSFDNLETVFPETVIEDVFKNLREEHPLLRLVDTQHTSALMKYIVSDPTVEKGFWGTIPDDIKQMLLQGFRTLSLEAYKLSGFVAVTKGFFELGPTWLANYVITIIREIMEVSLETAIVNGDGKLQPIGMMRKLSGAIDGVYPEKSKIKLKDLSPISLAGVHGALSEAKADNGQVAVLVNPMTYWAKLFPALAKPDANNNWHLIALPTGDTIIQAHAVPKDTLIFGVPRNYLLAVSGDVRLDRYPETLAIEDMDLFIAKFYGNGVAKNANAFFIADISEMEGAVIPPLDPEADVQRQGVTLYPSTPRNDGGDEEVKENTAKSQKASAKKLKDN